MHTTSASLLMRLRQPGQADAWARFVRIYTPMLFTWAKRMGLQTADAADLVQDVFTSLVQKLPEFEYDNQQRFRTWLWTITKNKWRDRRRKRTLPISDKESLDDVAAQTDDEVDENEFRQYVLTQVLAAVQSRFEERTWQAFWRQVVEGKSAPKVAGELDMTLGSVYTAKCRVISYLSKEFPSL